MARTGRRDAPALAVIAAVALLVGACAEPDLTVGVPNTTTTVAPTPRAADAAPDSAGAAPATDGGAGATAEPDAPLEPEPSPGGAPPPAEDPEAPTEPAGPSEPPGGAGPPPPVAPEEPAAPAPPPDPPPDPAPGAEIPGLTAGTLRVGVIADVQTGSVADGRSLSVHSAVRAWAAAVNSAGGLAGRTVEVTALDAGLFGHEVALAEACAADLFALVGSDALFDDEGVELLDEPDCSLVDFPARVHSPRRAGAPRTFQATPSSSAVVDVGALRWVADRQPVRIRSTGTFFVDFPVTVVAAERLVEAARGLGFELIHDPAVAIGDSFDPHVADMIDAGVHHVLWEGDTHRLVELLESAAAADLAVGVNCGSACHSALFLESAGATADGVLIWSRYLPLREEAHSPELAAYRQWLAVVDPGATPDLQGVAAWAAGRLFEEAVRRAVGAGTPEEDPAALSRESVAAAASRIVNWHGHGLHGASDPGPGDPTPCGVVMGVSGGGLFRFHPAEPGTFDCSPENLFTLETTAGLGLDLPAEPAAAGGSPTSPEPEESGSD